MRERLFGMRLRLYHEGRDGQAVFAIQAGGQPVRLGISRAGEGGGGLGGQQQGVSNDLTMNLDFTLSNNSALIRKIESNITQATSGTRTLSINFTANYVLSKRITLGAYFDHQVNTPLVSSSAYPTTNSSYGISVNLSLAK